jgi:hypothetical protein
MVKTVETIALKKGKSVEGKLFAVNNFFRFIAGG